MRSRPSLFLKHKAAASSQNCVISSLYGFFHPLIDGAHPSDFAQLPFSQQKLFVLQSRRIWWCRWLMVVSGSVFYEKKNIYIFTQIPECNSKMMDVMTAERGKHILGGIIRPNQTAEFFPPVSFGGRKAPTLKDFSMMKNMRKICIFHFNDWCDRIPANPFKYSQFAVSLHRQEIF